MRRPCARPLAGHPFWWATSLRPTRRSIWPTRAHTLPIRCRRPGTAPGAGRRTSHPHLGKVDRDALPWPPPGDVPDVGAQLGGTMGWLAGLWTDVLGTVVDGPEADFFALGGGSLSAAQLVVALRPKYPKMTVAPLRPSQARFAGGIPQELSEDESAAPAAVPERSHPCRTVRGLSNCWRRCPWRR